MAGPENEKKPHLILEGFVTPERYEYPRQTGGGATDTPPRNRQQHGRALQSQIEALKQTAERAHQEQRDAGLEDGLGLQIEFESFPEVELAFESLGRERSGIELLNVRHEGETTFATVFVPDGRLDHFENLIREYLEYNTDKNGRPRDHQRLVDAIREIHAASLRALWTDDHAVFPESDDESFWWEVWLPVRGDRNAVVAHFSRVAEGVGMRVAHGVATFPERTVLLVYSSVQRMKQSIMTLNSIAELRRAKETAEFFDSLPPVEQYEWAGEALERLEFPDENAEVPHICLMDTGVARGHPLLGPALTEADVYTVEPAWGTDDSVGHGTQMAGLSLLGDLTPILTEGQRTRLDHRLESVKLLNRNGGNDDDADHHAFLTIQGVAQPEVTAPFRRRIFSTMLTARDNRDRGRPSAWSSAIDGLASDADGQGETPRLFTVAAGNLDDLNAWTAYPESNTSDSIHDPAQAWNALTVGAFTELVRITEDDAQDYQPIAPLGGLSPFSTTSMTWQKQWPLKPDVVFEGGNAAIDGVGAVWMPSLSLLTTHHRPTERPFTTANATSAATALAARMAARLSAAYPGLWPETIRALIVHSAEWTDAMRSAFAPGPNPNKADYWRLLRHCGFGAPDIGRALWSASDSLTMIAQDAVHPYMRQGTGQPKYRDMRLHKLPWPTDALAALGETPVEMRVTLSYFIEPNPSARGVSSRYRYESHGLRFDVRRPLESDHDFHSRISAAARDEDEGDNQGGTDPDWTVGKQNRHRGSLHSDSWRGTAADLADRDAIAVYPTTGWWKTRTRLERYDSVARYALIVSIRAPETDVDLYTPVANQVTAKVAV